MKIYDFQKNKKIPAPLLDRYLDSNPSFRMKLREIDRGWTLDCSKYIPEDMMVYQHTSVKHMHPIEKEDIISLIDTPSADISLKD